ncbi:hypothetical protein GobsT_31800 [Gemmata obscuriglobus]|uniref:DUF1549 domain-containing protein n=1 Tax=Gemmata obscuriglobus TaxID=114 RepID=A0A2Z3GW43_9BACT|nr:DUF1549 domain-containing protein [Gemmata obscuriglobus]AWM38639.1 DUF1549 domain-containing protein [Gemmata obscuriglobus]QEG28402.1 hypothetical protein GobsT_31800 [Gemmata obscuriglobus]VTS06341.1 Uncharacterized protein OS=Singulisphaera acidiphila (strain ATCC BAA-1392 / DSM 18658 / VKM B-2454 / MOB10) GN=Sinac_6747 PE=4 SV=1: PSCyt2: PSD1 [Gemmata obscuriglobus UQM 2246]
MWGRNVLFAAVVLGSALSLWASLFPLSAPRRKITFDAAPTERPDFRVTVAKVNRAFRDQWAEKGLVPAPLAADLTVARRLSLALTGSVPSLEDVRQFEEQSPEMRVEGWAHHLLKDRRFADYFADRLARAYIGTEDGPPVVYRKRKFIAWLSDEFLKNTSYAEVVTQMIAAQGLNTDVPAVNFVAAGYDDNKEAPDPEKLAVRVSRAFLGLRIDCAQCHDHFLEPTWKQTHFQALAAFFGQTRHVVTNITDAATGEYGFEDRVAGGRHEIGPGVPFLPELLPATGTRRSRLAAWVTDTKNVYFARATVNRVWAMLFGRPLTNRIEAQTLAEMSDEQAPPALRILGDDFAAHGHDIRRLILLISSLDVFRLDSAAAFEITESHDEAWAVFPLSRLRPEQVIGNVIQAASVKTIDQQSHVFVRLARYFSEKDFVARYGDADDDEFARSSGTIPQRLLVMNGDLVDGKANEELLSASAQIAMFAPDDRAAVEAAYLTVLTRRPTPKESHHFATRLANTSGDERRRRLADLYWALFNSTELSWNH